MLCCYFKYLNYCASWVASINKVVSVLLESIDLTFMCQQATVFESLQKSQTHDKMTLMTDICVHLTLFNPYHLVVCKVFVGICHAHIHLNSPRTPYAQ